MANQVEPSRSLLADVGVGRLVASEADVGAARERRRQHALRRIALVLTALLAWLWWRALSGNPVDVRSWQLPAFDPYLVMSALFMLMLIAVLLGATVGAGRSPHVTYSPSRSTSASTT